jgi:indolepyruvate ferredoxin oxidoreductase
MLGYAWQKGRIPLGLAALQRAIELNGVQVAKNLEAFEWGRRCAHDLASVQALFAAQQVIQLVRKPSVDELVARRVEFLTAWGDADWARQYREAVERVRAAEAPLRSTRLTESVAKNLFKLMAYKDEYEVARLHTDPAFEAKVAGMFEGDVKLVHHLAPPLFARTDAQGHPVKTAYGPWMRTGMRWLARLKFLRGTAFDPFGRTEERRTERALITRYRADLERLLAGLSAERLDLAVSIARLPEDIRGFGHVKARHLAAADAKRAELLARWDA